MKGKKYIELANFNCTFGEKDDPMISKFEDIIYPAFKSDIRNKSNGNEFLLDKVNLIKLTNGDSEEDENFVMTGLIVKKTELEVKSIYREGTGIVPTELSYEAGPYSVFAIFLKNHRMLFIKNQKGSPGIKSFERTVKKIMEKYTNIINKDLPEGEKLPYALLNVTNIPSDRSIKDQLENVEKIKKLAFRMYPLNGDLEFNNIFADFRSNLKSVGSKTGNMNMNSPTNKKEVAKLIGDAGDKADSKLEVVSKDGVLKTIGNQDFRERIPVSLPEENSIDQNISVAVEMIVPRKEFSETSEENKSSYRRKLPVLRKLFDNIQQML